jgi:hypothetical protein
MWHRLNQSSWWGPALLASASPVSVSQGRAAVKHAAALGTALGLLLLAVLPPGNFSVDGTSMIAVAESLVTRGSFTVPPELGKPGVGGQHYSAWYPLASVLAVPFVAAGLLASRFLELPGHYLAIVCALILPALLTAATSSFVFLLALRLGASRRAASLAAMAYALGTIALVYARTFFAEPLLALLVVSSVYFTLGGSRTEVLLASVLAGLAILAKPTGIIVAPLLFGYLFVKRYPLSVTVRPILAGSAGVLLYMAYNAIRFGNPFSFGQPWIFSATMVPEGLAGLLVSPGRGLLWYSPVALLGFIGLATRFRKQPSRPEAGLLLLIFVAFLLLHAAWPFWSGGRAWGPRLLLPTLPLLLACAAVLPARWHSLLPALAIAGLLVNAPTLVAFYERYEIAAHQAGLSSQQLLWSPAHAPFLHIWQAAFEQVREASQTDVRVLMKGAGTAEEQGQLLRVVALWWWMLPVAHLPRWLGAAATLLAACLSLSMLVGLHRNASGEARRTDLLHSSLDHSRC